MFAHARRAIRVMLTLLVLAAAAIAVLGLWEHYMVSPWTRDGQVRVQVANIAPQVSGEIVALHAQDNQYVKKGDLLYQIDPADYRVKVELAQAQVDSTKADLAVKAAQSERRQALSTLSTSVEEKQQFAGGFTVAQATYQSALANLEQAKLNLARTDVHSPVNGYVTNLLLRTGDYANTGAPNISVIDADSYWVAGYFEETKLGSFKIGDPVRVELMGYRRSLEGHVESITRGISTANATVATQGLPLVEPIYTWVRLAQRIPVRIAIDKVPSDVTIAAGQTCTIVISPPRN